MTNIVYLKNYKKNKEDKSLKKQIRDLPAWRKANYLSLAKQFRDLTSCEVKFLEDFNKRS